MDSFIHSLPVPIPYLLSERTKWRLEDIVICVVHRCEFLIERDDCLIFKRPRKMKYFLALWLLLPSVLGDSCCPDTDCDDSCPWNNACNNGRDEDCKDRISGSLKCQDRTACLDFDSCDDNEAARRAGYLCDRFPFYNGGFPIDKLKWDTETENFTCKNASSNGKYCNSWEAIEDSIDEVTFGHYTCNTPSANNDYCQQWSSVQTEYDKCFTTLIIGQDGPYYSNVCCDKENYLFHSCCASLCTVSTYNLHPPQYEYSECICTEPSTNGRFCMKWYCEEYQYASQTFDTGREFENYTCIVSGAASKNGGLGNTNFDDGDFCQRWNGSIDAREEFELSQCQCLSVDGASNNGYCHQWTCTEKGMDYHWPNILWIMLPIMLAGLPQLSLLYFYHSRVCKEESYDADVVWWSRKEVYKNMKLEIYLMVWGLFLILVCPISVIAIWKSGLLTLFVVTIPIFILIVIVTERLHILVYHAFVLLKRQVYCCFYWRKNSLPTNVSSDEHDPRRESSRRNGEYRMTSLPPEKFERGREFIDVAENTRRESESDSDLPPKHRPCVPPMPTPIATAMNITPIDEEMPFVTAAVTIEIPSIDNLDFDGKKELRRWKKLYEEELISYDMYKLEVERILLRTCLP